MNARNATINGQYSVILKKYANDAKRKRTVVAPTVISLFAGCGGSSLGYAMAGFRELLAVELDDNAVESFKLNFDCPMYHDDITKITKSKLLSLANVSCGELDVLDGSPPCQGFSTAGPRKDTDDRNNLFVEYCRLLNILKPKIFVMENVIGMIKGKMKIIFAKILRKLKSSGYDVKVKVLAAQYFQVPQARQRLIFIGTRNDLPILPQHPKSISYPITIHEAIEDVIITNDCVQPLFMGKRLALVNKIKQWGAASDITKNKNFSLQRLKWNMPSRTICKTIGTHKSTYGGGLIHPDYNRHLTINELKRIGSFPDDFKLVGSFQDRWARIGNSVPPLLMRAIALECVKILDKVNGKQNKAK